MNPLQNNESAMLSHLQVISCTLFFFFFVSDHPFFNFLTPYKFSLLALTLDVISSEYHFLALLTLNFTMPTLAFTFTTRHINNWASFPPWPRLFILFRALSSPFPSNILNLGAQNIEPTDLGAHLLISYLFTFSYHSWGSWGKNTGVMCHSLLQWATFCQNSPPLPIHLGWPCKAWLLASLSCTRLWSSTQWTWVWTNHGRQWRTGKPGVLQSMGS